MLIKHLITSVENKINDLIFLKENKFRIAHWKKTLQVLNDFFPDKNLRITRSIRSKILSQLQLSQHMFDNIFLLIDKFNPADDNNLRKNLVNSLLEIKGIGIELATKLINAGLSNLQQLKLKKYNSMLNLNAQINVKYNICNKIPHEVIKNLESSFENQSFARTSFARTSSKNQSDKITKIITGSFRRKKPFSSDVDVLVYSDRSEIDVFDTFLKELKYKFIPISKGPSKMSLLLKLDHSDRLNLSDRLNIKLDVFLINNLYELPSMLLYSTGSKEFNIKMRATAKKMGYLLNQKGLFHIDTNIRVKNLNSEEDYFKKLNLKYIAPEFR